MIDVPSNELLVILDHDACDVRVNISDWFSPFIKICSYLSMKHGRFFREWYNVKISK